MPLAAGCLSLSSLGDFCHIAVMTAGSCANLPPNSMVFIRAFESPPVPRRTDFHFPSFRGLQMLIGRMINRGAVAALFVSLGVGISVAANAADTENKGTVLSEATRLTVSAPGAPVYFDKTFSAPGKMQISKSKNGEPDFEGMSESSAVRVGCGPAAVTDLVYGVGNSTQYAGVAWGLVLLALSLNSLRKRLPVRGAFIRASLVLAAGYFIPVILIPFAFIYGLIYSFKILRWCAYSVLALINCNQASVEHIEEDLPSDSVSADPSVVVSSLERCLDLETPNTHEESTEEESQLCLLS